MDEEDKVRCAACDDHLLNELAISVNGVHLYDDPDHDWTTIRTLSPVTKYESYVCLGCANEAFEQITETFK